MAYGNWGGRAYRNGEHMPNREDNTPYREEELAAGYYQVLGPQKPGIQTQHVTLGSQRVRLCGYKCYPGLFLDGVRLALEPFFIEDYWGESNGDNGKGEIEGYKFEWAQWEDPAQVELRLVEPDGTVWTGFSGYGIGAGHDPDDYLRPAHFSHKLEEK